MAHAMEPVARCEILRSHPRLTFRRDTFAYEITTEGDHSTFTVSRGTAKVSVPILYAFGLGSAGQTYVFRYEGSFYQSRVSYYTGIQGLDLTIGAPQGAPRSLEEAMGAVMTPKESQLCFGCHSTGAVGRAGLQVEHLTPGITCEGCHGPGGQHAAAIQTGNASASRIFNPASLSAEGLSDFCGSCHRTWEQVQLMNLRGVLNIRFQPYRLGNSRCFDPDDKRISCLACHDPHQPVRREAAFYDSECLACHPAQAAGRGGRRRAYGCPVAKGQCVTCHMPKYELPGAHFKFADHQIRVVRPNERYPD